MSALSKREDKPKPGRPIEADSLRQAGTTITMRVAREEKARWGKRAKKEGRALTEIIRALLNDWEQGKRS